MNWTYRVDPSPSGELVEPFYGFKFYKTLRDENNQTVADMEITAEEFKSLAPSDVVTGFRALALEYLKAQLDKMLTPLEATGTLPTNIAPYSFGIAADSAVNSIRVFLQ